MSVKLNNMIESQLHIFFALKHATIIRKHYGSGGAQVVGFVQHISKKEENNGIHC